MSGARSGKQTADYFQHETAEDLLVKILRNTYRNDGSGVWWRLCEILGATPGHAYHAADRNLWLQLVIEFMVSEAQAEQVLAMMADIGLIDKELWGRSRIIWSEHFMQKLGKLYERRKDSPGRPSLPPGNSQETPLNVDKLAQDVSKQGQTADTLQQSRVEESRGEERRDTGDVPAQEPNGQPPQDRKPEDPAPEAKNYPEEVHRLCDLLETLIKVQDEKFKRKSPAAWLQDMDRLLRIDSRPADEVEQIIRWAAADKFWSSNILSPGNLREKYSRLLLQSRRNGGTESGKKNRFENSRSSDRFRSVQTTKLDTSASVPGMPGGKDQDLGGH